MHALTVMKVRVFLAAMASIVLGLIPGTGMGATVATPGTVLGPDTWQAAQGLLPQEILDHYRHGEYVNRIADIANLGPHPLLTPPDLLASTRANRGRYMLTAEGSIVDVGTGKHPLFITGLPFDPIDPNDPRAAAKVVWNYFYATWYRGDCRFLLELVMLGRRGVERRVLTEYQMRMYDGAPEVRDRTNTGNLLLQTLARVVSPADLEGTLSLTWRYRDADRRDTLWTYVPGLRRPRQLSPLNRSDGFLGSDISLDDGPFFDGKAEDFAFRLLGRQEQLVLMDPYSLQGVAELVSLPDGGWRIVWKDVPRIGADDPAWRGLPWAPVSHVLVRRPVWVVEAVPNDPNYLYGRIVFRFDAETFQGSWASKYDRGGTLVTSYQVSQGAYYTPDGGRNYVAAGGVGLQVAESFLYKRATVALFPPRNPQNPADYRVLLPEDRFNPDVLVRLGR